MWELFDGPFSPAFRPSPLIIPDDEGGESGADPSFSMESEDHDSGDSSDESEGGGEEPLFPHPPVSGESHEPGTSHRVPQNQEPGDNTGTSPAKAEKDSQESQLLQQHDTSLEVDLSLPPGQVPRPDAEQQRQQELNPTSPVFYLDLEEDPKKSSGPVNSNQASKSCDQQDLTLASGKDTQVSERKKKRKNRKHDFAPLGW